ncbi:unnamed protein product [Choristocarpus tenellus]
MAWAKGDLRLVTDMARISVVCKTAGELRRMFDLLKDTQEFEVVRVTNGFRSSYTPGGYRDVKMNVIVPQDHGHGHLCELQLHLRTFFDLKEGSHKVYEWARDLHVTHAMEPYHLFHHRNVEVTEKMVELAKEDWKGLRDALPATLHMSGRYSESVKEWRKVYTTTNERLKLAQVPGGSGVRRAKMDVAKTICNMVPSMIAQGLYDEADKLTLRALDMLSVDGGIGDEHPLSAEATKQRGDILFAMGKYEDAASHYQQSLEMRERVLRADHPDIADSLHNLAVLRHVQVSNVNPHKILYKLVLYTGDKVEAC